MDILQYLNTWAKGEIMQGRIMLVIGIKLLFWAALIFRNGTPVFKGMLIPLLALACMTLGYGYALTGRNRMLKETSMQFQQNPQRAAAKQYSRFRKDFQYYKTYPKIYISLAVLCVVSGFFINRTYLQGFALGLAAMFAGMFLIDAFSSSRLQTCLEHLEVYLLHSAG